MNKEELAKELEKILSELTSVQIAFITKYYEHSSKSKTAEAMGISGSLVYRYPPEVDEAIRLSSLLIFWESIDRVKDHVDEAVDILLKAMRGRSKSQRVKAASAIVRFSARKESGYTKIRWIVFQRDNFKCVYCGRSAKDGAVLHVDHIHPQSLGGTDEMENLATSCRECNLGKSDSLL